VFNLDVGLGVTITTKDSDRHEDGSWEDRPHKPFFLEVDASDYATGVVLFQKDLYPLGNGTRLMAAHWRSIGFHARDSRIWPGITYLSCIMWRSWPNLSLFTVYYAFQSACSMVVRALRGDKISVSDDLE